MVFTFLIAPILPGEHNEIHAVACFKQFSFQTVCGSEIDSHNPHLIFLMDSKLDFSLDESTLLWIHT